MVADTLQISGGEGADQAGGSLWKSSEIRALPLTVVDVLEVAMSPCFRSRLP